MEGAIKKELQKLLDEVRVGLITTEQAMEQMILWFGNPKKPEPNWDEAPDWAMWWVVNENGLSYYTKFMPVSTRNGYWGNCGEYEFAGEVNLNGYSWRETLTKRP